MTNKNVLLTGGAGYIGSHVALALNELGYRVVVLDNLSTGHRELVPDTCEFVEGDAGDQALLGKIFSQYQIGSVMHFAGSIIVEESVAEPLKYYRNNTLVSLDLIEACVRNNVNHFIFSSTAAVYGTAETSPVTESMPLAPVNPYGHSKAMTERFLQDVASVSSLRYIALRYFNVSGSDPQKRSGQLSKQSTHLIKVACETATGKRDVMTIFGDDYDTPDGSCIRDFIHVSDLAMAHVKALEYLHAGGSSLTLNCGYGQGYSVKQVLAVMQEICDGPFKVAQGARRPGDVAELVADNRLLLSTLDWTPRYNDLKLILTHALEWEKQQRTRKAQ